MLFLSISGRPWLTSIVDRTGFGNLQTDSLFKAAMLALSLCAACGESIVPVVPEETAFDVYLAGLDAQIAGAQAQVKGQPGSVVKREALANLWLSRARATGQIDDYEAADNKMDEASNISAAKPWLSRAILNFTLHRLDACEADLDILDDNPLLSGSSRREVLALRGDLAYHRSDYAEALRLYQEAYAIRATFGIIFRLALYYSNTNQRALAEAFMEEARNALPIDDARNNAWLTFQAGVMDLEHGRLDDALDHFNDANSLYSGWYLIEEHIAEVDALQGRYQKAEAAYRDIVARTGLPEFMDALAGVLEAQGETVEAATLREQAGIAYEDQLQRLPAASSGHALDHFLETRAGLRAVTLAEANHTRRPNAEATLQLAQAYALEGDPRGLSRLQEVLDSPFRTDALADACTVVLDALQPGGTHPTAMACAALDGS